MDKHIHVVSTFTLVFIFLLSHTTTLVSAVEDPWTGLPMPPELSPELRKHLEACGKVLTQKCGIEVYNSVLGSAKIDHYCCKKLIQMGEVCNDELATALGLFDKYKHAKIVILLKSRRKFNQCKGQ